MEEEIKLSEDYICYHNGKLIDLYEKTEDAYFYGGGKYRFKKFYTLEDGKFVEVENWKCNDHIKFDYTTPKIFRKSELKFLKDKIDFYTTLGKILKEHNLL